MNFITLDISTKTGIAYFKEDELMFSGVTDMIDSPLSVKYPSGKEHPEDMIKTVIEVVDEIFNVISHNCRIGIAQQNNFKLIDFIGIEQTNIGKDRYKQKLLEWIHYELIIRLKNYGLTILYLDTGEWRRILGLNLTKDIRNENRKTKRKKERGKITTKHLSVNYVNERFNKDFRMKDEDECEAICLGCAFLEIYKNLDTYMARREKIAIDRENRYKDMIQKRKKK